MCHKYVILPRRLVLHRGWKDQACFKKLTDMARFPFGRLEETEIRKPSKVRMVFFILFLLLLILSVTFIALYFKEKTKSIDSSEKIKSTDSTSEKIKSTYSPYTSEKNKPTNSPTAGTCLSPACATCSADILNKLDESTNPCDDFYQYSCGGFLNKTHLPDGKPYLNSFSVAEDFVQNALREILQNDNLMSGYSEDSAVYKAFTYYKSCMNENYIKNDGVKPILDAIEKHGSWNITNKDWNGDSWKLEKILARALVDLNTPAFLSWGISRSLFDTSKKFVTIGGGISAYDRGLDRKRSHSRFPQDYLEDEDPDTYEDYKILMSTIFKLLGSNSNSTIDEEVNRIVGLEKEFKKVKGHSTGIEELKKNIKFMTVSELNKFTSYKFDWSLYFEEILSGTNKIIPSYKTLMIIYPDNIKKIVDWLHDKPKSLLANEIMWNVIRGFVETLPEEYREAEDKYIKSSSDMTIPRWRTCNHFTDGLFQYVTTLLYVNRHLSEDARNTAEEMFKEIKSQFIDGLEEQTWMDYATRAQARLKLQKMTDLIGFPTVIKKPGILDRIYEDIQVDQHHLFKNTLNVYQAGYKSEINGLDKTQDDELDDTDRLSSITYLSINAFYNPEANGMTVLAGILQPPFYKHDRLKALNYGSLGMVVGHEITHGFDKTGSEFDEKGNLRQWWTKKSHENFVKRSTCLIEEYDKVKIFGYQVNGNKTLSENIADNGGLKYAFRAYQNWRKINGDEDKLPGLYFNNDQLFFVGFAQLWCSKYTKEFAKTLMDKDVHSLNPVRVRVPLSNFPEFSKAFGCTPRKNTCAVW